MDGSRFDTLTRALALSRRGALKAVLGAALAGMASGSVRYPAAAKEKYPDPFKHLGKRCKDDSKCSYASRCEGGVCKPLFCLIGGQIVPLGMTNPADPCQWCFPSGDPNGWTVMPDGLTCPLDATPSTCIPSASCQAGSCEPTVEPDGTPCGTGLECFRGACRPADGDPPSCTGPDCPEVCTIEGKQYPAGYVPVEFPCLHCDPKSSTSDWTPFVDNVPCQPEGTVPVQVCCSGVCCWPDEPCCSGTCCSPDEECCPGKSGCWPKGHCDD